jgi:hypothetical protein
MNMCRTPLLNFVLAAAVIAAAGQLSNLAFAQKGGKPIERPRPEREPLEEHVHPPHQERSDLPAHLDEVCRRLIRPLPECAPPRTKFPRYQNEDDPDQVPPATETKP